MTDGGSTATTGTPQRPHRRRTVRSIAARKGADPIVCLTAYTAPIAHLVDPHVDLILVGDSLGMVVYGMEDTLAVSLDMMIAHGRAVTAASRQACVIVDLPFATYQGSPEQAFHTAARVMQETGCSGIKLEGGEEMADTVAFLVARGIPVMGHVGLRPQSVHAAGGYRTHGRDAAEAQRIRTDAEAITRAGAFSVVIEGTTEPLARDITMRVPVPTIGIGASAACDGQVLVIDDLLGLSPRAPRFAKRYADLAGAIDAAVGAYAAEVRARTFPAHEHMVDAPTAAVQDFPGAVSWRRPGSTGTDGT